MNKWFEIFFGLILIVAAILGAFYLDGWLAAALIVLQGGIVWFVLCLGILFVLLGISELKG